MELIDKTIETISREFAAEVVGTERHAGHVILVVKPTRILDILRALRDGAEVVFDFLTDLYGVDYFNAGRPERFAVVYQLYSTERNVRLAVKAYLPESAPEIASATALWPAADWAEREAYDLLGISFLGHPNLQRLMLPDDYVGHPLRKEYPLKGRGERDRFEVLR